MELTVSEMVEVVPEKEVLMVRGGGVLWWSPRF